MGEIWGKRILGFFHNTHMIFPTVVTSSWQIDIMSCWSWGPPDTSKAILLSASIPWGQTVSMKYGKVTEKLGQSLYVMGYKDYLELSIKIVILYIMSGNFHRTWKSLD